MGVFRPDSSAGTTGIPRGVDLGVRPSSSHFGIRIWATDHIGVRGEYRFDEDRHEAGFTHSDSEMTAGVFWTF